MTGEDTGSKGERTGPRTSVQVMTERSALGGGAGYSLIELTCAMALAAALVGISIPATRNALDEIRAAAAARDMAARIGLARLEAARRSSAFAYRFVPAGADYRFTPHANGNERRAERSRSPTAPISRWLRPSASPTNIQGSVLACSGAARSRWLAASEEGVRSVRRAS